MSQVDDKATILSMAQLLREELREVRFTVVRLQNADARLMSHDSMSTALERVDEREHDAGSLREMHDAGAWKRDVFRSDIRVETVPGGPAATARLAAFEDLLEGLGVVGDGYVAQALGCLLIGPTLTSVAPESPEETFGVSAIADLWRYVLIDACLATPHRTATKVIRWTRGAYIDFSRCVLIGRLRVSAPIRLANGITIEELPRQSEHLVERIRTWAGIPPSDYLGRTMLRIPCTIAPVLSRPTKIVRKVNGIPSVSWRMPADVQSHWPLPFGGIQLLVRALSLVCDVDVEAPVIWSDYGDLAHFGQQYGSRMSGGGDLPRRYDSESPVTASLCKAGLRLQPKLTNPGSDVETAIRYWLKSKSRGVDSPDAFVFLRTALESLFLDRGSRAELTFRLATRGAWYTGRNRQERLDRYNALKNVYAAASGAVHTGRVKNKQAELLKDGQEICRLAILKRLRSKKVPVWNDIVFGG